MENSHKSRGISWNTRLCSPESLEHFLPFVKFVKLRAGTDCKPEVERLPVMALTGVRQKCCSPMENCSVFRSHFFIQECPPTNLIFYWICPLECKGFNLSLSEPNASWVSGPVYGVCMECSHAFGHSVWAELFLNLNPALFLIRLLTSLHILLHSITSSHIILGFVWFCEWLIHWRWKSLPTAALKLGNRCIADGRRVSR